MTGQTVQPQGSGSPEVYCEVPVSPVLPRREMKRHDRVFAWISLLVGFLFMRYAAVYADGFATTGVYLLIYVLAQIYLKRAGLRRRLSHRLLGAVLCGFSLVFSLTASPLLHGLCFCFLLPGTVWQITAVCTGTRFVTRFLPFDLMRAAVRQPIEELGAAPEAMEQTVKDSGTVKTVRTVLIGLLVTVPLTAGVGALLASADSGVERILHMLMRLLTENVLAAVFQLALGIPVGFWCFAVLWGGAEKRGEMLRDDSAYSKSLAGFRFLPNAGICAGVTPICVLYLLYVISQANYFFAAFSGRIPNDMIYSEYARRGFFELCAIAVINLAVLLVMNLTARRSGGERPRAMKICTVLLCLFTLFMIATALAKMLLYIRAYGLTPLRLYTAWFMVLLAAVFAVLLLRIFLRRLPTAAVLTAVFAVMFGALCFSRPDALIAEYNLTRYEQGTLSDPDLKMLCGLSDDAYVVMAAHRETLTADGNWAYYVRKASARYDDYEAHPDRGWNLSALLLKQEDVQ